ncbi:DUF2867 domain-containing protein [Nitratireductor aquimarinus]|uniref:DUF2867 domain-containing protein n=1 Tax=Nitratireductor aquimarinus TaxID=889300 RepID=UPI003B595A92
MLTSKMGLMSKTGRAEAPLTLPGAGFSDTYSGVSKDTFDASAALTRAFARPPRWIGTLMRWRNAIVRPFGLKTGKDALDQVVGTEQAPFPVLERSSRRIVLGTDDRHLDFRLIVEADPVDGPGTRVSCTTLVRPHNPFGWLYLLTIMPFHKLIVANTVRRIVA